MKKMFFLGLITLAFSCSNEKMDTGESTSIGESSEAPVAVPVLEKENEGRTKPTSSLNHSAIVDSALRITVQRLQTKYSSVPFYFEYKNEPYFYVGSGDKNDTSTTFGLTDREARPLLETDFDKLYNPDVTLVKCIEVKQGDKLGLFNYAENVLLEPQFDYIVPEKNRRKQVAYGTLNGSWYKIEFNDEFKVSQCQFDFSETLRSLQYSTDMFKDRPLINIEAISSRDEHPLHHGSGVVIAPSYIARLRLIPDIGRGFILKDDRSDFGLDSASISSVDHTPLSKGIVGFIVNLYESTFDTRGGINEEKILLVLNKETNLTSDLTLNSIHKEFFCQEENILFINDTLVEVQSTQSSGLLYHWESTFSYYSILPSGEIQHLKSNRNFDASKFTLLEERHFKGCFGKSMTQEERDQMSSEDHYLTVWRSDHLSIEDLDIMRNEIFAEYGYKFSTAKWQDYFGQFAWYRPAFDNVDDQLSETDKANIKTILELKERMLGKEQEFTKKKAVGYSAPG